MIRRARKEDAKSIHEAHMLSIQSICSKEHSPEEIRAWGHRPYQEEQRVNAILNDLVWVVELDGKVEGYAHLRLKEKASAKTAHIFGLYLTRQALGRNFGKTLVEIMIRESKVFGATSLTLESTLTAHPFYQKMGFKESGEMITIPINGTPIRCIPMEMDLTYG